jgi:hypothetical protein
VLPRLPAFPAPIARALAGALLVLLAAVPARALEIVTVAASRDDAGRIWVTTRLTDPIEARAERSLLRGMPATLEVHAELWRRREGWFDRMEMSTDAGLRVRYDVWSEEWRIERAGAAPMLLGSIDSLEIALSRPIALAFPAPNRVPADGRCYVVVTVTVKPLNVEDVQEVEGWLSGEVNDPGSGGFGVITQLPRSVFDAVRNFAGFGDSHDRARTPEFTPSRLPLAGR